MSGEEERKLRIPISLMREKHFCIFLLFVELGISISLTRAKRFFLLFAVCGIGYVSGSEDYVDKYFYMPTEEE
ncbi:hypothetical protein CEXT_61941 [Caerostris extrusa]|uniref:Uncharacterized protein n=1 Tax=Caerostris extrusa TaxID=172846 RepID=A0AAV4MUB5_CAEEX|nr:hypothetical protein CEXT_61941 [Caerostris extrusa]